MNDIYFDCCKFLLFVLLFTVPICIAGWLSWHLFKSACRSAASIWSSIPTGTKSILVGAHCFALHPWFVAAAWTQLYGFPLDPRLWVAFFVHDLGYAGKRKMDDKDGETHPELGARIMHYLFDMASHTITLGPHSTIHYPGTWVWYNFSLLHSRYYAKRLGLPFSRLCRADKLAFALTPRWLYLPMARLSGEIDEYLGRAKDADTHASHFKAADYRGREKEWHVELCRYMRSWVAAHPDDSEDTWTSADRHTGDAGVWK